MTRQAVAVEVERVGLRLAGAAVLARPLLAGEDRHRFAFRTQSFDPCGVTAGTAHADRDGRDLAADLVRHIEVVDCE